MTDKKYDIVAIGNAIVDMLAEVEDAFIEDVALKGLFDGAPLRKGGMTLIDQAEAKKCYDKMPPAKESSGGSAANSLADMAKLGSKVAFIGKVKDDQFGEVFRHDMRSCGVAFDTAATSESDDTTARCYCLVTPDAERTMATYLGVSPRLTEAEVDGALIADSKLLFIEGYMWDQPEAMAAVRKGIAEAKKAGTKIAMTLSDAFCVHNHRADFRRLVQEDLDVVFANEQEIMALYETEDFGAALMQLKGEIDVGVVTHGPKGVYITHDGALTHVPTAPVEQDKLKDTTGAGDAFAGGFLHAYAQGRSLVECAELGNGCARQVIQKLGARLDSTDGLNLGEGGEGALAS